MSRVSKILDQAKGMDRKLARNLRKAAIESFIELSKEAAVTNEQHGALQNMQRGVQDYPTRQQFTSQRGGQSVSTQKYDTGPKHQPSKVKDMYEAAPSLSTRYSPDGTGRMSYLKDGIQVDHITGREYNWNEGFTTEDGTKYPGGSVDLQSDLYFDY